MWPLVRPFDDQPAIYWVADQRTPRRQHGYGRASALTEHVATADTLQARPDLEVKHGVMLAFVLQLLDRKSVV